MERGERGKEKLTPPYTHLLSSFVSEFSQEQTLPCHMNLSLFLSPQKIPSCSQMGVAADEEKMKIKRLYQINKRSNWASSEWIISWAALRLGLVPLQQNPWAQAGTTSQTAPPARPLALSTIVTAGLCDLKRSFPALNDCGSVKEDDHAQRCLSSPRACWAHSSHL